MKRSAALQRSWEGAALWSGGFRPFFLGAALWAIAAVAIWPALFTGAIAIPTAFSPVAWHVHEMLFGYGAAVVAGFLLTAIPNWTGRLPVAGRPLAALAALWLAGRIAVFFSAAIGWTAAAVIDVAFLAVFAAVAAGEVAAGRNLRNAKVVVLVALLALGNAGFHVEAAATGAAATAGRAGIAVIVFLILLIGGRVVPSFTHNWLARTGRAERPVPFGRADAVVMVLSALALLPWIADAGGEAAAGLLLVAGFANLWRLSRWRGWQTRPDRLVLVLHVAFLLTNLGFLAAGLNGLLPAMVSAAAALHVWAIGGIGMMTLAMMTRATLGHSGKPLAASRATRFIYAAAAAAMLARIAVDFWPAAAMPLIYGAALAWTMAFAGFVLVFGPMVLARKAA